eukprot:CCRYP_000983-RA/>CCRYP_000983-RA protein AED:0.36 eAED:0.37 QI:0/0/0/1/1/1/5/0/509
MKGHFRGWLNILLSPQVPTPRTHGSYARHLERTTAPRATTFHTAFLPSLIQPIKLLILSRTPSHNDSNRAWQPSAFLTSSPSDLATKLDADIEHMCAGVVHPTTGETITSYKKLIACPLLRDVWTTAFGKEFGNLAQGDKKTEYMKMPLALFPDHIRAQYNLDKHAIHGFVYLELRGAIYGLPQAGTLANKLLRKRLAPHGYYEVAHTPGLWRHVTRPISFTLVVDDFGVKYVGQEHAEHLINVLKENYTMSIDWDGKLYCGIQLDWDYNLRTLDISMPRYIDNVLQRFQHPIPSSPQNVPYKPFPKKYGAAAQDPLPKDASGPLDSAGQKRIQQILLDYCASHPNAIVRFTASDMILNIHSDASYLSETKARSRIAGHFFLGSVPVDDKPITLNGAIYVFCGILKFVVASAAEAELGALFLNCKEGTILRLVLQELGHPQPPTPTHCDNETATGIANNTVKKQRSRSMEMRFFWIADQVTRRNFQSVRGTSIPKTPLGSCLEQQPLAL